MSPTQKIWIKQIKEPLEIFSGFETKNKYEINLGDLNSRLFAAETGKGWIKRNFLGSLRPFEITIKDNQNQELAKIKRPFRFYFHEAHISTVGENKLGSFKRLFSLFYKTYDVYDGNGNIIWTIKGPIWRPWTFRVYKGNSICANILKEWSGMLKEAFSDADNFRIELNEEFEISKILLLISAVLFVDFIHFEKKKKGIVFSFMPR